MKNPNSIQQTLLERAARSDDGTIKVDRVAKPTIAALVRKGWMLVAPQTLGADRLLITEAGRKAAGVVPPPRVPSDVSESPPPAAKSMSKLDVLAALLRQPRGATIEALMAATGWQAHSVRGAIAGALKKRGLMIKSEKTEQGRVYRIEANA